MFDDAWEPGQGFISVFLSLCKYESFNILMSFCTEKRSFQFDDFIDFSDFENSKLHLMLEAVEYVVLDRGRHGTFSVLRKVPKVEFRNPSSRKYESRSQSPFPDFSILSPAPESRIFWFCVPVPVPVQDFLRDPANPGCPFCPAGPGF